MWTLHREWWSGLNSRPQQNNFGPAIHYLGYEMLKVKFSVYQVRCYHFLPKDLHMSLNVENVRLKYKYLLFWLNGCREAWYIWLWKDKTEEHSFLDWDTQGRTAFLRDASVSLKPSLDGIRSFDWKSVQHECAHRHAMGSAFPEPWLLHADSISSRFYTQHYDFILCLNKDGFMFLIVSYFHSLSSQYVNKCLKNFLLNFRGFLLNNC